MNVEIVVRPDAHVLGITARINPMEADYNDLWRRRFDPHAPEVAALAAESGYYGVYYGIDQPNMVDFVAGQVVAPVERVPEGLTLRAMPGGAYAAFRCTMREIGATWRQIYGQWLPASGYVEDASRPSFEYFAPGPDETVILYLPVSKA